MDTTDYMINADILALAESKGLTIEVGYSEGDENPRVEFETSSTFVTRNNNLTNSADDTFNGYWGDDVDEAVANYACERGLDINDMMWWKVYAYSHGNISFSTTPFNCRWDSGLLGFIFESKKAVRDEFGVKRISAKLRKLIGERINGELSTLTQWANGEVYSVYLKEDDDVIASLHGIYSENDEYTSEIALQFISEYEHEAASA